MAEPRKLHVFLCHASQDKPLVRALYQKLLAEGWIEPWLDEEKLLPGQDWDMEIEKAVRTNDAVVVCLSNNSVTKEGYVQHEMRLVLRIAGYKPEGTIFVIPIRLDDCPVPMRFELNHYVDFFPSERKDWAYGRLLAGLRTRAESLSIQTTKLVAVSPKTPAEPKHEPTVEKPRPVEEKRPPEVSTVRPPAQVREEKPVNPTYSDRLTLNGMEFCRVPAGKFLMGSADMQANENEIPQHTVDIPYDYWLARFPATNAQYAEYLKTVGKNHPVSDWQKKLDHPVTRVLWKDAMAYCRWLNNLLKGQLPPNYILRLPTEAEWEKAARGTDGRIYPWGNVFDKSKCNTSESGIRGTTSVGKYSPQGDSPYGCAEMSGNVWECTYSLYKPYPYLAGDGRENEKASGERVFRGGSLAYYIRLARCACRSVGPVYFLPDDRGFRVAASPSLL